MSPKHKITLNLERKERHADRRVSETSAAITIWKLMADTQWRHRGESHLSGKPKPIVEVPEERFVASLSTLSHADLSLAIGRGKRRFVLDEYEWTAARVATMEKNAEGRRRH
jgi:hypothetical protein